MTRLKGNSPVWDTDRRSWRPRNLVIDWRNVVIAVAVIVLLAMFGDCRPAFADEREPGDPCPYYLEGPRRKALSWDEVPGLWFRMDIARCLLADVQSIPKLQERVKLLDEKLELKDGQIADYKEAAAVAVQEADIATGNLEAAVRGKREAEEKLNHWSRSRLLWAGIGAAAVIAGVLVAGQI